MSEDQALLGQPQPGWLRALRPILVVVVGLAVLAIALVTLVLNLRGGGAGPGWGLLALFLIGGALLEALLLRFLLQGARYPRLEGDILSGFSMFDGAFHVDLASVGGAEIDHGERSMSSAGTALKLSGIGPKGRRTVRFLLETSGARVLGPTDWSRLADALAHNPDRPAVRDAVVWLRQEAADRT